MVLSISDTNKSNDLSSICYAILEELSKIPNYHIKKCQNCGIYFIPTSKVDEIYIYDSSLYLIFCCNLFISSSLS